MKTCFKCNRSLPLSDFYKHPQMGDGYLGKCKTCTKSDTAKRHLELSNNPEWVEKEMERHRLKAARRRQLGKCKLVSNEAMRTSIRKYRKKNPQKYLAHRIVAAAIDAKMITAKPCEKCGARKAQAHHEDYSFPLAINWLCQKHHAERHVEMRKAQRLLKLK